MRDGTVITRRQALASGVTPAELRGPRFQRLLHGVYLVGTSTPTLIHRIDAALLCAPDSAVLARHTAAAIWGVIAPHSSDIQLNVPENTRLRVQGIRAECRLKMSWVSRFGYRLSPIDQVFCEMAAHLELVDLVVLGDSIVKRGLATVEQLRIAAAAMTGRGSLRARRAAVLVRPDVESPMETRLRLLLVLAGLPEPTVQFVVARGNGKHYRLDLAYPEHKVAIEYDGRQHIESSLQHHSDVRRDEWLTADGWLRITAFAPDLREHPADILKFSVDALRKRGLRVSVTSTEWQKHFSGWAF